MKDFLITLSLTFLYNLKALTIFLIEMFKLLCCHFDTNFLKFLFSHSSHMLIFCSQCCSLLFIHHFSGYFFFVAPVSQLCIVDLILVCLNIRQGFSFRLSSSSTCITSSVLHKQITVWRVYQRVGQNQSHKTKKKIRYLTQINSLTLSML